MERFSLGSVVAGTIIAASVIDRLTPKGLFPRGDGFFWLALEVACGIIICFIVLGLVAYFIDAAESWFDILDMNKGSIPKFIIAAIIALIIGVYIF